jgi:hypothetical protein
MCGISPEPGRFGLSREKEAAARRAECRYLWGLNADPLVRALGRPGSPGVRLPFRALRRAGSAFRIEHEGRQKR